MKKIILLTAALMLGAAFSFAQTSQQARSANSKQERAVSGAKPATLQKLTGQVALTGPFSHDNLSIYLVESEDLADATNVLTLDEALEQKKIAVQETGNVNELSIENLSPDKSIFLQAGDIVKGGKQDRTLAVDFLLRPKSGHVPVAAFCVEHGRWRARGEESVQQFGSSKNSVPSKDLKLAVRKSKNQSEVWDKVAESQQKLGRSVGGAVSSAASPSSMQLSLENGDVKKNNSAYLEALRPLTADHPKAIGFVAVINGAINSAEIYSSHSLFTRLRDKMIEASVIEALAEKDAGYSASAASSEQVLEFLAEAEDAPASKENIYETWFTISAESTRTELFEGRDEGAKETWMRRSCLLK